MGQMCRHSLALSGGRLWGVGGFDGQNTLAQTFCIDLGGLGQLTATSHTPTPHTFEAPHACEAPLTDTLPPRNPGAGTPSGSTPQLPGVPPKGTLPVNMGPESKIEGPGAEERAGAFAEAELPEGVGEGEGGKGDGDSKGQERVPGWRQLLRKATGLLYNSVGSSEGLSGGVAPESADMDVPSPADAARRMESPESAEARPEREDDLANGAALDSGIPAAESSAIGENATSPAFPAQTAAISEEELQSIISRVKSGELLPSPRVPLASKLIACSIAQGAPLNAEEDTLDMPNGGVGRMQTSGTDAMEEKGGLTKFAYLPAIQLLLASLKLGERELGRTGSHHQYYYQVARNPFLAIN
jgi:hypothetical protein